MKRFNLFFIAVLFLSGLAMAQPGSGKHKNVSPETRAAKMTERMTKELSLNDQQAKEIETVNLEFVTQLSANRVQRTAKEKKEKEEIKKMRGNMKEAREARDTKLKSILTEEQYAKYQKENAQREGKMNSNKKK